MASIRCISACLVVLTLPAWLASARAQIGPPELIDDLVLANHILFDQGVLDGFGHVSVRNPANPEHFFLSRARAPSQIEAEDIIEFDLDGKPVAGPRDKSAYSELFIHSEVLRARPDVNGVVHSHSPDIVPFGVVQTPLRPLANTGMFLCGGAPIFDISEYFPDAPYLLVNTGAKGKALAKTLGGYTVALMRGHGDTVVGPSLRIAVSNAIYTALAGRLMAQAIAISGGGPIKYLSESECANAKTPIIAEAAHGFDRSWENWVAQANLHFGKR
jgi:ribulose-5-phosphate 4-epimerase/fuculose-1-phosphate aldolase